MCIYIYIYIYMGFVLQNMNFVLCNGQCVSECIPDGASHK
jgi:hypothetical protein